MDVEMSEQPVASGSGSKVVITPESPYDLEAVMANYQGRDLATRLQFIASRSHSLAGQALKMATQAVKASTLDVGLYEQLHGQYAQFVQSLQSGQVIDPVAITWIGSIGDPQVALDREWIEKSRREADSSIAKLEVELKGYQTNLIKESIRMGYRDLARMQQRCGNLQAALASYTKSREFCVSGEQVLEVCLAIVQIALEMRNYALVRNWVVKAEGQLETLSSSPSKAKSKGPQVNLPGMQQTIDPAQLAKDKERQSTAERLAVAGGIAQLGMGQHERAARAFTGIGKEALESSNNAHFVPPADIALYAVLTSLASFNRSEVRVRLLENSNMRPFLDAEPYLRDILRAYQTNDFKRTFHLLDEHSARQRLDVHLSPHVSSLLSQIRTRALLTYFAPFATLSLSKYAQAFGTTSELLEPVLVDLITNDKLDARIDLIRGTIVKRVTDVRRDAFDEAVDKARVIERDVWSTRLRMRLIEAGLIIKAGGAGKGAKGAAAASKKQQAEENEKPSQQQQQHHRQQQQPSAQAA